MWVARLNEIRRGRRVVRREQSNPIRPGNEVEGNEGLSQRMDINEVQYFERVIIILYVWHF
jgi:hypothetical protein